MQLRMIFWTIIQSWSSFFNVPLIIFSVISNDLLHDSVRIIRRKWKCWKSYIFHCSPFERKVGFVSVHDVPKGHPVWNTCNVTPSLFSSLLRFLSLSPSLSLYGIMRIHYDGKYASRELGNRNKKEENGELGGKPRKCGQRISKLGIHKHLYWYGATPIGSVGHGGWCYLAQLLDSFVKKMNSSLFPSFIRKGGVFSFKF